MKQNQDLYKKILNLEPSKGEARKIAILDAVLDAIANGGIHQITSQEIAKRAKMGRSHVVYYFKNRDEMLDAAVDFALATAQSVVVEHLADENDPQLLLENYVKANFAWHQKYPHHGAAILLLFYMSSCQAAYRKKIKLMFEMAQDRIVSILTRGKLRRSTKPAEVKLAAEAIYHSLLGGLTAAVTHRDETKSKKLEKNTIASALSIASNVWND